MRNSNRWALVLLALSLTTTSSFTTPDYGPPIYPSFQQLMERLQEWGEKTFPSPEAAKPGQKPAGTSADRGCTNGS